MWGVRWLSVGVKLPADCRKNEEIPESDRQCTAAHQNKNQGFSEWYVAFLRKYFGGIISK